MTFKITTEVLIHSFFIYFANNREHRYWAYNYLCLVFHENWSNFDNLSLFGKMPQRKESLFRDKRSRDRTDSTDTGL